MPARVVAGRYRLGRRLGTGGMSEVWAAEDVELGRPVALKLLGSEADPARFEREARAAAALAHPNVNQLFDYGEWEGRPYMVLELLPGGTLEDRLRDGRPLPDGETATIAGEIAAGLAHAHVRGLVHRDLKPANVLFDADGRAKIADFGIARMGGAGTLTEAGTLLGTAAYVSPEQAAGDPATAASDVYSFGVILFRMLTGQLPFEAEEPLDLVALHREAPPPPVATLRRDAPPRLAALADACLAKDPGGRPPDGGALTAGLGDAAYATEAATAVIRPSRRPRRRARVRRSRLAALLVGLLAAAAAGVAIAVLGKDSSSKPAVPSATTRTTAPSTRTTTTQPAATRATTSTSTSTTTRPGTTHRPTTSPAAPPPAPEPPPPPPLPPTTEISVTTTLPTTAEGTTTTTIPPPIP